MGPNHEVRELDIAELAEIYRRLNPTQFYYGDPPERWARNILLKQLRVHMARLRLETHEAALRAAARDRAGEAWAEGHYQPGVTDPAGGGT